MSFITIPINAVRKGEAFTPIEKMGEIVFNPKRKKFERKWIIAPKAYRMGHVGKLIASDDEGNDAIFALGDYAIVRRDNSQYAIVRREEQGKYHHHKPSMQRAKATVDDLLNKFKRS